MLFNSHEFIFLFMPITFIIYFLLNKYRLTKFSKAWLVFASLFFYSWWNTMYLPLILISILFNYSLSSSMSNYDKNKKNAFGKRTFFIVGLAFNICLLGYFKYMDFFISNANTVLSRDFPLLNLALPLAISFFTLQQIAFIVDAYEGLAQENDFLNYVLFVAFFPQLIAGPIVHHKEIMPQFDRMRNKIINYRNIAIGLFIFSLGLFKKVVIADTFASWATKGFTNSSALTMFEGWVTSISYTFQIYFDFSGYSDMAIGASLLFNIKLPINFNSPYRSLSIIEFWQRWHMTLSNFITIYIYTPLVKSFKKLNFRKAMIATLITFLIVGFWHGASWKYVIYGGFHGIAIIINHYWRRSKRKMPKILAWLITFNFLNTTFVVFRAENWSEAFNVLKSMFDIKGEIYSATKSLYLTSGDYFDILMNSDKTIILSCLCALVVVLFFKNSNQIDYASQKLRYNILLYANSVYYAVLFLVSALAISISKYTEFLYFNF